MGAYLEVRCLACGDVSNLYEEQIEQAEYRCPHCGVKMARSQWRRAKCNFYMAEEILRQAAGILGDEECQVEARIFDWVCRSPGGLPVTFGLDFNVNVKESETNGNQEGGVDNRQTG